MNFRIFGKNNDENTTADCFNCDKRITHGIVKVYRCELGGFHENHFCWKCGVKLIKNGIKEHLEIMRIMIGAEKQEFFDKRFKEIINEMLDDCLKELREEE